MLDRSSPHHVAYHFGDDTTTVQVPSAFTVRLAPEAAQPDFQDTASFQVLRADGSVFLEATASHFSSGNRSANLERFQTIIEQKLGDVEHPQAVMGDINTEVRTGEALQQLADRTGLVVIVSSLKIRRLRGLQDQLHKRMDRKDDYDSMFVAVTPRAVDADGLAAVPHQNVAWPGAPERLRWKTSDSADVAQAWVDDRLLTDHAVVKCPLVGGAVLGLGNAARANYDKYDIQREARIPRRTYLAAQQVLETAVADAVLTFVASLEPSPTLTADTQADVLARLQQYRSALGGLYDAALSIWDDADDLTGPDTPLGAAIEALGLHSQTFVKAVRLLSWEDVRDAPGARAELAETLTASLVEGLGVGSDDRTRPLGGHDGFDVESFRRECLDRIEAAWSRIIQRQSAGDLYKMWFAEVLHGQTTGGMPIPAAVVAQPTEGYIAQRMRELGLEGTICVMVEALR